MNRYDIRRIIRRYPTLNSCGFGFERPSAPTHIVYRGERRTATLADLQEDLLRSAEVCTLACEWLQYIDRTKSPRLSSYFTKTVCEEAGIRRYISNGAFIAAAVHLRIPIFHSGGPNVDLGLSWRSVRPWFELTQPGAYCETTAAAIIAASRKPTFGRSFGIAAGVSCAACVQW